MYRAALRLKKRKEGFHPSATCGKYMGLMYLDSIRSSRISLCSAGSASSASSAAGGAQQQHRRRALQSSAAADQPLLPSQSSVDCYTAPAVTQGNSSKATVSLCHSRNLVSRRAGATWRANHHDDAISPGGGAAGGGRVAAIGIRRSLLLRELASPCNPHPILYLTGSGHVRVPGGAPARSDE